MFCVFVFRYKISGCFIKMMILFYSTLCTSSKLLIDNIKRYNAEQYFKLVDVAQYIKKLPPQIHSVPALMFKETRRLLFGKEVFDYLLLPSKGFLLTLKKEEPVTSSLETTDSPAAFALFNNGSSLYGDNFAFIDDVPTGGAEKSYTWCSITENIKIETPEDPNVEKGTSKKDIPDIATLRSQRETEIEKYIPAII